MKVSMRHYVPGTDYGEVYRLFTDMRTNELIISKPDHNAMNVFQKWLDRKLEDEFNDFMIFRGEEGEFVGFAYSYDFQPLNGHCVFTLAVKEQYRQSGMGAVISIEFLKFLFSHYDLRKVYIHIYGNNEMSIRCAEGFGFALEGVLKEYKFSNSTYVDLRIYAITREKFENSRFLKRSIHEYIYRDTPRLYKFL